MANRRKRLLTWKPNWRARKGGGRWSKQINGRVKYFGHADSPDEARAYRKAEQEYLRFLAEREATQPVEIPVAEATVTDICEKFVQHLHQRYEREEIGAPHLEKMRYALSEFAAAVGHSKRYDCIGELDLEDYKSFILSRPISPKTGRRISLLTARGRLAALRALYRWAYKMFLIDRLPRNLDDIAKIPPLGEPDVRQFSLDEVKALWANASPRLRCFIALALNCGFGQTDLAELRMSEVDWANGYIERARSKTRIKAKYKLWPLTLGLLQEHRNPDAEGNDRVFITRKGNPLVWKRINAEGKYQASDVVGDSFWRLGRKLEIDGHRGFYSFRKTGATWIESNDPAVTEMYLAHAEPGMKRHYAQRDWPRLAQALDRMFAALREVLPTAP